MAGEEIWCQLFSEPGAGSDLAGLSTRAVRDGDEWVVTGQKVWTSFAHIASFGILLARTDPDVDEAPGDLVLRLPDGRSPGVTIRPIVDMTGDHAFNEVFLDEVRLPADHLVGEVNGGWALAKVTLGNERVSLSGEGALWGQGPTAGDLVDAVRRTGGVDDAVLRQRLAQLWVEGEVLRLIRLRTVSAALAGRAPGPEASVRKALADDHGQRVMELAQAVAGTYGMLADAGPDRRPAQASVAQGSAAQGSAGPGECGGCGPSPWGNAVTWPGLAWAKGYLFSRALTIGGGTAEVQRNIIAERVLGLPHDLRSSPAGPGPIASRPSRPEPASPPRSRHADGALDHPPDERGERVGMAERCSMGRAGDLDHLGRRGRARPARRWPCGGAAPTCRRARAPRAPQRARSKGASSRRRSASSATRAGPSARRSARRPLGQPLPSAVTHDTAEEPFGELRRVLGWRCSRRVRCGHQSDHGRGGS